MNLVRVILAVCICCSGFAQTAPEVDFSSCNFQAIGHRGYSSVYPENTLLALEEAFKRGIKICEIDVRVTTDDVYILFHDSEALHRTSNGKGAAEDFSYAQLQSLEVGSWKGGHFAGLSIPTLEDALLLAQRYDAQLYLDTKTLRPDLMQLAIQTTGVDDNRLMPSLNDSANIADFTSLLPSTPWVWFKGGLLPDAVDSIEFYQALVNQNCVAFEVSSSRVEDEEWLNFEENVHLAGAKTWVFTENNNEINLLLSTKGVDVIESDRAWEIMDYVCNGNERNFPDSLTRGNWRFTNGLDNVIGQGSQLRLANYRDPSPLSKPLFGRCEQFSIADLESGSDSVMYVPKQDVDGGLFVYTNAVVEDYGIEDQHYTIVMDVLFPESSLGNWIGLLQTNTSNLNDAELFINPQNQIGVSEQYFGDIQSNTWYRIAVSVNISSGFMKLYLDGVLQGEIEIETNRWAVINSSASGEKQGFLLFSDDDEETQAVFLASFQFRDYELDAATIANLGGVKAVGIPSGNADLWKVDLPDHAIVRQLLDYDNFQHHVWLGSTDIGETELVFTPSKNAVTLPVSGSVLDWSTGAQTVLVTSDDGSITKSWQIILHESAVAVNEEELPQLLVYPNPSVGIVSVQLLKGEFQSIELISLEGKMLFSRQVQGDRYRLDIRQFAKGNYILKVKSDRGVSQEMLVKS
jgi:glycerophosphoryl diester phosphodiesterase